MKVVFAGPSLSGTRQGHPSSIDFRAPAFQGDVYAAVVEGANVIGILDGFFESVSSVWHKEILHALSSGVRVFGAASMGALRAAECVDFGMIGVGEIFEAYRDGTLIDDDAVALAHGPSELGYMPLTVPLVNVIWTVAAWRARDLVDPDEAAVLLATARSIFFKDRTWRSVVEEARFVSERAASMLALVKLAAVDQKALDALMLVREVEMTDDSRTAPPSWEFSRTDQFERFLVRGQSNAPSM
jgi:hypothetical protein